ncbi:hypothetical protein HZA98_05070 [Candidatus Woesearchaeota archaeon]|nr:hypothetical protein [Candidatus Woesearchaeota archaeon]
MGLPRLIIQARQAMLRGNFSEAENCYTRVLEATPGFYEGYIERSWAYRKKGDRRAAMGDLEKLLSLTEDYEDFEFEQKVPAIEFRALAYLSLGKSFSEEKQDSAIGYFTEALDLFRLLNRLVDSPELTQQRIEVYFLRAEEKHRRKQYADAIDDLTEGMQIAKELMSKAIPVNLQLKLRRDIRRGYANRGFCYQQEEDYASARKDFFELGGFDGNYLLGMLHVVCGPRRKAELYLTEALKFPIQDKNPNTVENQQRISAGQMILSLRQQKASKNN